MDSVDGFRVGLLMCFGTESVLRFRVGQVLECKGEGNNSLNYF